MPVIPPPAGVPDVTACVLFYGDHAPLARRFLECWRLHGGGTPLRIGLNACCAETAALVAEHLAHAPASTAIESPANLGKSGMMRRLLRDPRPNSEWVVWFDDDSFPFRADWLLSLGVAIDAQPGVAMLGIPASIPVDERLRDVIAAARWYRGKPLLAPDAPGALARLEFVVGGFWALRSAWIETLDWPDERLVHFEEDYLLGEALRQHGGTLGYFRSGVRIDTAPRRAPASLPRHCA